MATLVLGGVDLPTMGHKLVIRAYDHALKYLRETGDRMEWTELVRDPALQKSVRQALKSFTGKPYKEERKVKGAIRIVHRYRKIRQLVNVSNTIAEELSKDEPDIDELELSVGDALMGARSRTDETKNIFHIGKGNNSSSVVNNMLHGKAPPVMRTGVLPFDEVNGGIPYGSMWTIAADSGGGKSACAANVALNAAEDGVRTCIVTLEMNEEQMMARFMGIKTGLDVNDIQQKKLNKEQKRKVEKAYARLVKRLKKKDSVCTIFPPGSDMTIEEILFLLKPYGFKFIIIDYASLLKGNEKDEQWKVLQQISRFGKVWAHNTKSVVALLAQLDDGGNVKYSRALKENASNMWTWTSSKEFEETSILEISQPKARNQRKFPFRVLSNNLSMRWTYPEESEGTANESSEDTKEGSRSRKRKKRDKTDSDAYIKDVNEE